MGMIFKDFFTKFPMEFSELYVIKQIHKELECAEKTYKKDKDGDSHLKYLAKAYAMLEVYFTERGITNPEQYF